MQRDAASKGQLSWREEGLVGTEAKAGLREVTHELPPLLPASGSGSSYPPCLRVSQVQVAGREVGRDR